MSEKEKKILESLDDHIQKMDESDRMYFLGRAEGMAYMKERLKPKKKPSKVGRE